jgi:YfiR/HmsC-like
MKRIRVILFVAAIVLFSKSYGQNEKFKALFIYNFTNYIDWPGGISGSFVITVLGDSPIVGELQTISKIKKVGSVTIEVRKANSIAEIGKPNIVFVPASKKRMLSDVNQSLTGKPTLIVSDNASSDFAINFIEVDQKQSFQISKSNIEAHKLKVSASLFSLGIVVR